MSIHWRLRGRQFLRNSRLLLIVGFGGLLLLLLSGGTVALRGLQKIQSNNDQIRRQFLLRNRLLNDIRSKLYLSGTYVRDYLLEPDPRLAERHRQSLGAVKHEMEAALQSYEREVRLNESGPVSALRSGLEKYWRVLDPLLNWNATERVHEGYFFLRDEVYPRRTAMLTTADQIARLNEQQLEAGSNRTTEMFDQFRGRLRTALGAFLAFGLAMAAFTIHRILNLEHEAAEQYSAVVEAKQQLKELSARLVEAQENERRAISRELHDEVGQSLSAVLVETRNLSSGVIGHVDSQLREHIGTIKALVENSIRVVRNMSLLLRPSMLDDLGLVPALRWQAREVARHTALDVSVSTESVSDNLPDEHKTAIYRIVQEALHNCSRHANATTVRINVLQSEARLNLTVQDDGRGFEAEQRGMGLLGIEERVSGLGGTFRIHSEPGKGTLLIVEFPISTKTSKTEFADEINSNIVG